MNTTDYPTFQVYILQGETDYPTFQVYILQGERHNKYISNMKKNNK